MSDDSPPDEAEAEAESQADHGGGGGGWPAPLGGRRQALRVLGLGAAAGGGVWLPGGGFEGYGQSADGGWKIVKIEGRDYVAASSLQAFYRFKSFTRSGKKVIFASNTLRMEGTIGSQELFINGVKFILSYSAREAGGDVVFSRLDLVKLIDPVLRPSYIRVAEPFDTVVIDAGHGGHDSGGRGIYGNEKDYNLDTARRLATELRSRNLKIIMTRSTNVFKTLGERVSVANKTTNAVFVSIHFNSGPRTANGIETFALAPQGASTTYAEEKSSDGRSLQGNRRDSENVALATAVHASVLYSIKKVYRTSAPRDRGVKRARYYVLRGITRPAILVEGGFLTNRNEARLVHTPAYRGVLAQAIAQGINNYRNALRKR